jgi:hypothetical protein
VGWRSRLLAAVVRSRVRSAFTAERRIVASRMWNPFRKDVPLDVLHLEPMASGHQALVLSHRVTWEAFPSYAPALAGLLGGKIVDKADSAAERLWTAVIEGQRFFISYDDYPFGVSLEPRDDGAATLISTIRERLLRVRDQRGVG